MSANDSSSGTCYRPNMSAPTVRDLTRRVYGLHVLTCRELDSYDDRNFHVTVCDSDIDNDYLQELWPHGYVLKVLNSQDSRKPKIIKAKCEMILHAHQMGFPTPRPVPNTCGQLYSLETLVREQPDRTEGDTGDAGETDVYLVRLFEYLPGTTLSTVDLTPRLAFQVGRYAALLDKALQDFDDTDCPELLVDWNMQSIPSLRRVVHVVKDTQKVKVVSEVIEEFDKVLNSQELYQTGVIHSDFNDHNILVQPAALPTSSPFSSLPSTQPLHALPPNLSPSPSSTSSSAPELMDVCGILDFGDATKSLLIVEAAVAMVYMAVMCPLTSDPDQMAGHVLAGYLSEVNLTKREIETVPLTMCARLAQSLIMGHYKLSLDPENHYIMVHAEKVWPHLHRLWSRPCNATLDLWRKVAEGHGVKFSDS